MGSRNYCMTIHNPTSELAEKMVGCWDKYRYLIIGYEIGGETNKPHFQCYIELHKPARFAAIKKMFGRDDIHFEPRRGTREQARDYCRDESKEGKTLDWVEVGDWEAGGQGKRNDLISFKREIQSGKRLSDIAMDEKHTQTYALNRNALKDIQAWVDREATRKFREVTTEVIHGTAGSGKSEIAFKENENEGERPFIVNPNDAFPFDGYDGENTIILDEFYGQLKYDFLLRILDGHQLRLNIKGSHTYARWTKIIITSNKKPEDWYKYGLTPALKRRLSRVTELRNEVSGNTEPTPSRIEEIELDISMME